jgi:hypothetical protein
MLSSKKPSASQLRQRAEKLLDDLKAIERRQPQSEPPPILAPLSVDQYIAERVDDLGLGGHCPQIWRGLPLDAGRRPGLVAERIVRPCGVRDLLAAEPLEEGLCRAKQSPSRR